MPYTLIKGSFHIHYPDTPRNGPEPDGDTVKFQPDNPALLALLPQPNRPVRINQRGITTLRFEGIDALETHFRVDGTNFHQNLPLANGARDHLLAEMGFGRIEYFDDAPAKVRSVENHPVRGYVLSNGLDTFGRVIALVFVEDAVELDGAQIFLEAPRLLRSLNAAMLTAGQAYGAFYVGLPVDLREALAGQIRVARESNAGLWPQANDDPGEVFSIPDIQVLQELVIWPKLFRRLAAYFDEGFSDLAGFEHWLRADPVNRDDRLLLPGQQLGNMHDLYELTPQGLSLRYAPETVVIVPDDFALPSSAARARVRTASVHVLDAHLPRAAAAAAGAPAPVSTAGPARVRLVAACLAEEAGQTRSQSVLLLNAQLEPVDMQGWYIASSRGRQPLTGRIPGGGVLQIDLDPSRVALALDGDTLAVQDAAGNIHHLVSYGPGENPGGDALLVFA